MHLVNQGQLAAALILAGVSLPAEFNLEESVLARKDEELRGIHPKLDKVAIDLLAQVAAAKDLAAELSVKKADFDANLPPGASAAEAAIYRKAHADKTIALTNEIEQAKAKVVIEKAHADAEVATLQKHGLMRNDKGELVPFKDEAELKAELEPETPENVDKPIKEVMGTGPDAQPVQVAEGGGLEPVREAKAEEKKEPEPEAEKEPSGSIN